MHISTCICNTKLSLTFIWVSKCDVKFGNWDLLFKITYVRVFYKIVLKVMCFKHTNGYRLQASFELIFQKLRSRWLVWVWYTHATTGLFERARWPQASLSRTVASLARTIPKHSRRSPYHHSLRGPAQHIHYKREARVYESGGMGLGGGGTGYQKCSSICGYIDQL